MPLKNEKLKNLQVFLKNPLFCDIILCFHQILQVALAGCIELLFWDELTFCLDIVCPPSP